ncbi:MAG TPA: Gfo/Idh/MocA family oxidoreductase [Bryobacteraceae bacterium]|jgi:hypothetical protein|nr:Gfo/Idh/MocA family oxidoreductase [Bryobacteraceae bacterium]
MSIATTTRRDLLRAAAASATVLAARAGTSSASPTGSMIGVPFQPREKVRMGLIGAGLRGNSMLKTFLATGGVEFTAICDIVRDHALEAQKTVQAASAPETTLYTDGDHGFEDLVKRDDVDVVYIATPWEWHVPAAVAAMNQGKHALVEVPAATTIEDCWKLVNTSERTRRHCIMCENCCYGENELMVLNMVRAGLFGDIVHGEGAYIHDLRRILNENRSEGLWRRFPHTQKNGNLYPTHGLGPVANYMGVQRGDRFDYLVSMSSPQRGLDAWRAANVPKDSPKWKEKYVCGDMNTSLIKTANGLTIMLQHDVVNPRPYDRINLISGTKGVFRDYPPRIYVDDPDKEAFLPLDNYKEQYTHRFWKQNGERAKGEGDHGGMDFVMAMRLVEGMRRGLVPDMDVYDAAAWSAPGPLSVASVAQGSAPQAFPDFTRGRWRERRQNMA